MTQPVYFLGLNGPPGSGKDTLGEALLHSDVNAHFLVHTVKYAKRLKDAVHVLFGGTYSEEAKNEPSPYGPTWRQLYIGMSEIYAKPLVGKDVFGQILVDAMKGMILSESRPTLFVATDCGFVEEQYPVINWLGGANCKFIQINRAGKDFTGDSRGYIVPEHCETYGYHNSQPTVQLAQQDFRNLVGYLAADWGWVQ